MTSGLDFKYFAVSDQYVLLYKNNYSYDHQHVGHGIITVMLHIYHTMMPSLGYHIDVTKTSHCEVSHHDNTVASYIRHVRQA